MPLAPSLHGRVEAPVSKHRWLDHSDQPPACPPVLFHQLTLGLKKSYTFCFNDSSRCFSSIVIVWNKSSLPVWLHPVELFFDSCCCCSIAKSCLTLCNPMNCSMPGFPVRHYLLSLLRFMSNTYIEMICMMWQIKHLVLVHTNVFLSSDSLALLF